MRHFFPRVRHESSFLFSHTSRCAALLERADEASARQPWSVRITTPPFLETGIQRYPALAALSFGMIFPTHALLNDLQLPITSGLGDPRLLQRGHTDKRRRKDPACERRRQTTRPCIMTRTASAFNLRTFFVIGSMHLITMSCVVPIPVTVSDDAQPVGPERSSGFHDFSGRICQRGQLFRCAQEVWLRQECCVPKRRFF